MKISKLSFSNGVCYVKTEDGSRFKISDFDAMQLNLKSGLELDSEFLEKIQFCADMFGAKLAASRMVARGPKNSAFVLQKLKFLGYSRHAIAKAVEFLEHNHLIDDYDYANKYVKDAINLKHKSKLQIKADLVKKNIKKEIIENILSQIDDNDCLLKSLQKELKKTDDLSKVKRRLYSKGYCIDSINKALEEI